MDSENDMRDDTRQDTCTPVRARASSRPCSIHTVHVVSPQLTYIF